jgi:hypothetical protein
MLPHQNVGQSHITNIADKSFKFQCWLERHRKVKVACRKKLGTELIRRMIVIIQFGEAGSHVLIDIEVIGSRRDDVTYCLHFQRLGSLTRHHEP